MKEHHYDEFNPDNEKEVAAYLNLLDDCVNDPHKGIHRDEVMQWKDELTGATQMRRAVVWWREVNGNAP